MLRSCGSLRLSCDQSGAPISGRNWSCPMEIAAVLLRRTSVIAAPVLPKVLGISYVCLIILAWIGTELAVACYDAQPQMTHAGLTEQATHWGRCIARLTARVFQDSHADWYF